VGKDRLRAGLRGSRIAVPHHRERLATCPASGPIRASNPSRYMFLDDTACNLASINLLTYRPRTAVIPEAAKRLSGIITRLADMDPGSPAGARMTKEDCTSIWKL